MLPKKRKFTAADYDRFVGGSPSHASQEHQDGEETARQTAYDDRASESALGESHSAEAVCVDNDAQVGKRIAFEPGENSQPGKQETTPRDDVMTASYDQETLGIDLSRKRHDLDAEDPSALSGSQSQQQQQQQQQ